MKKIFYIFLIIFFIIKNLNSSDCKDNFDKLNTDELRQYFLKLQDEDKNFASKVALYLIIRKYFSSNTAAEFYKENIENLKSRKEQIYNEIDKKFAEIFSFPTKTIERWREKIDARDFGACHSFYKFCYSNLNDVSKKELETPESVEREFKDIVQSMLNSFGTDE